MVYTTVLVDPRFTLILCLVRSLFSFVSIEMNVDFLFRHPFISCGFSREFYRNAAHTASSLPMTIYSISYICAEDVGLICEFLGAERSRTPLCVHHAIFHNQYTCVFNVEVIISSIHPSKSYIVLGFLSMYMLVVLTIKKDPYLCPSAKFTDNLCMLAMCPTKYLEHQMVCPLNNIRTI